MKSSAGIRWAVVALLLIVTACKSTESGIISYDPPGATTQTKDLDPHHQRTIGITATGVWVSNEFDGGRLSDFYHVEGDLYRAEIYPENAPINRSAWYAFKVWSDSEQNVEIELTYRDGRHRYWPKLSHDGITWSEIDSTLYHHDQENESAKVTLSVGPDTLWVSAQELYTSEHFYAWFDSLAAAYPIELTTIGQSHLGRDIKRIIINDTGNPLAPMMIITGRQHPPEVTGSIAQRRFIETLLSDDPIAIAFRQHYQVVAYPLMNPDGIDGGHWRHNFGGVDLNRDWNEFNQPETRAVGNDLLEFKRRGVQAVYGFDFHSTAYDVFYTIRHDIPTNIPGLSDRWLAGITELLPDYPLREEAFGVAPPVAKNWKYHTFNTGAVTYEVGDSTPRALVRDVAHAAAISMMRELVKLRMAD